MARSCSSEQCAGPKANSWGVSFLKSLYLERKQQMEFKGNPFWGSVHWRQLKPPIAHGNLLDRVTDPRSRCSPPIQGALHRSSAIFFLEGATVVEGCFLGPLSVIPRGISFDATGLTLVSQGLFSAKLSTRGQGREQPGTRLALLNVPCKALGGLATAVSQIGDPCWAPGKQRGAENASGAGNLAVWRFEPTWGLMLLRNFAAI